MMSRGSPGGWIKNCFTKLVDKYRRKLKKWFREVTPPPLSVVRPLIICVFPYFLRKNYDFASISVMFIFPNFGRATAGHAKTVPQPKAPRVAKESCCFIVLNFKVKSYLAIKFSKTMIFSPLEHQSQTLLFYTIQ